MLVLTGLLVYLVPRQLAHLFSSWREVVGNTTGRTETAGNWNGNWCIFVTTVNMKNSVTQIQNKIVNNSFVFLTMSNICRTQETLQRSNSVTPNSH